MHGPWRQLLLPVIIVLFTASLLFAENAGTTPLPVTQQTPSPDSKKQSGTDKVGPHTVYTGPMDEYNRGNPRSAMEGFLKYASKGKFETAAKYLDLRYLPRHIARISGEELARQLKIILDRSGALIDLDHLSAAPEGFKDDSLPPYRDYVARIRADNRGVDILLQHVPRKDGILIWKISNSTVARIPYLYSIYGYSAFEEKISRFFPDIQLAGWQLWQWGLFAALLVAAYMAIWLPTWLLSLFIKRRQRSLSEKLAGFITGPLRILLWYIAIRIILVNYVKPSVEIQELTRSHTIGIFAFTWAALYAIDILTGIIKIKLCKNGRDSATVLLKPVRTFTRSIIITIALLVWLDNLGIKVSALIAGLGVGGIAVALAAQDTLKNLLGTIMIFLDSPYKVGERIVVKGHDGEVEEIGLRSTRIRLLTGHLSHIPNDEMARSDIENIGRRPHIRRRENIRLALDTPPEKITRAVSIIRDLLNKHEGMNPANPPRVFFDKFTPDALNIVIFYWYHPPEYWDFLAFSEKLNIAILEQFKKENIRLAPPSHRIILNGISEKEAYYQCHTN